MYKTVQIEELQDSANV